jgi:hypothetical protein
MPSSHIRAQYEIGQPWEAWAPMARAYGPIRSEADIIRALRFIQFSCPKLRMGRRAPSISLVARAAGLSRMTLYRITRDGTISEESKGGPSAGPPSCNILLEPGRASALSGARRAL